MQPCCLSTMSLAKTWVGSRVPWKFSLNTKSTPLGSRSKKVFWPSLASCWYSLSVVARGLLPPAPLTRMSQGPRSWSTWAWTASRASGSSTLAL